MTALDEDPVALGEASAWTADNGNDAYRFQPEFMEAVRAALDSHDLARLHELIDPLHAADLADLIGLLQGEQRHVLVRQLASDVLPDVLSELDETVRDDVISDLAPERLADAVSQLESDDAVYVIGDLDEEAQREVLDAIAPEERAALEESLSYPEQSAGRLMRRELVAVPVFWTVGQTIVYMRDNDSLPEEFHEIFVVDPRHHPVGTVSLGRILRSRLDMSLDKILQEDQRLIPVDMDQEEVAYLFQQYNLMSAAVVDAQGRLVGAITIDDVVDVINEEAEEDILRLGGVKVGDLNEALSATARTRFVWLLVNLGTAVLASAVISLFDASIEKLVALAVLMPIVASMGGNAGTQTMTVAVRALATRELTWSNAYRIINREMALSLINGVLLAILLGAAAGLWSGNYRLGGVLAMAMIINMLAAGAAGILIPLGLERVGIDPAASSTVFVTTVTDVVGFFSFLGIASFWLL